MKQERVVNNFLRSVTILCHLSNNSLNKIQQNLEKKTYQKGEIVVNEGQSLDYIYLIFEGEFVINKKIDVVFQISELESKKESKKVSVVQISSSHFFGCQELIQNIPSQFQLVAHTDQCIAYLIPKKDLFNLITFEEEHLKRVVKICDAWNQFLIDLVTKAQKLIVSKKQFLVQNKLQIKEAEKIQKIKEAKVLNRFLPEICSETPKNKKISQAQDVTSLKHTLNELLPSRIKGIKSMANLQQKSDIFSEEFYQKTNNQERAKLDQVRYDKQLVNFNLQNRSNIIYNKVEIFAYSKNDENIISQPRAYKNELIKKINKAKQQEGEDLGQVTPKQITSPKHEKYFKSIDKRLCDLKNKYSGSQNSLNSYLTLDSPKSISNINDYSKYIDQPNSIFHSPKYRSLNLGFTSIKQPKSIIIQKSNNKTNNQSSLTSINVSPYSTPL
ncbi:cyclic nucleotide-binding domain protein (macronuclear) [Tetrahymena thermophila SB210]|uniref:Cyclic nucleotide-binding domain protein n=1 Tax=Tetrahymena thermophila (strain SB210) TaxID=312017 RepID=Q24FC5_TETTS|nr:cyclic nucleotide-binding domain protein [Tetrahymena thermophila SB210]EAS06533.1 cyclic nucleotide-binding domain protein [Tetrahymena thermophila SB210]|eukprot:XP_001026778.1 cyclic nucleotide-binding domain protein [Tetrahymena thermophila SB210]